MRAQRYALLLVAAIAAAVASGDALAQGKVTGRAPAMGAARTPTYGGGGYGAGGYGGGYRGGWNGPVIMQGPQYYPPGGGQFVDDPGYDNSSQGPRRPPQRSTRQGPSGAPPANERRLVPDEVVIEVPSSITPQAISAIEQRHRLTRLETQTFQLSGTTIVRWRIPDRRSVAAVVRALEADATVASAQPNYLFTMQDNPQPAREGDEAQYALAKLRLPQAHTLAKGGNVLIAVIDSGIDATHPELAGTIAQSFDALKPPFAAHKHGTAIASLIAAHGRLMGSAPEARILAVRAFDPAENGAEGTTFNILKGLDWAAANHARIINMSFAGPSDPAVQKGLAAAHKMGIVLIAAAGNAGPKSPPLYPAADPNVIAVSATGADDKVFAKSNRGNYISVAAPGEQILAAIPDGGYEVSSGTSYSAAEVSGIVALMLERNPGLTPDAVRTTLEATARDLGPKGRDPVFGAGLADAYRAVGGQPAPLAAELPLPRSRLTSGAR